MKKSIIIDSDKGIYKTLQELVIKKGKDSIIRNTNLIVVLEKNMDYLSINYKKNNRVFIKEGDSDLLLDLIDYETLSSFFCSLNKANKIESFKINDEEYLIEGETCRMERIIKEGLRFEGLNNGLNFILKGRTNKQEQQIITKIVYKKSSPSLKDRIRLRSSNYKYYKKSITSTLYLPDEIRFNCLLSAFEKAGARIKDNYLEA